MRRYALLLGNAVPPEGLEDGVQGDIAKVRDFLAGEYGGAWREDEVLVATNAGLPLLDVLLPRLGEYDFLLVYVSLPAGTVRDGAVIPLNPEGELVPVRRLEALAARQVNVYDCCSAFVGADAPVPETPAAPQASRAAFERSVAGRPPFQISLHACKRGMRPEGSPLRGGIYTEDLLAALREVCGGQPGACFWEQAHRFAALNVALRTDGCQLADMEAFPPDAAVPPRWQDGSF